jgi:alanine dehydrogenase
MVMHVKDRLPPEYDLIREDQIVFTYLLLAAAEELTHALIKSKAVCIAHETIQKPDLSLPLLTPMSEVAGRMAIQQGAKYLEMAQGGCFETSKATPHTDPIYTVDGVVHYCVANMPGAVPRTLTLALTNATLPYAVEIANKGWQKAMQESNEIKLAANVIEGKVTYQAVADAFDREYVSIEKFM